MCKHQLTQVIQWKFVPTCRSSSTPIFFSEHNILGSNTQFLWRGIIGVPVFVTLRQSHSTVFAEYFLPFTLNLDLQQHCHRVRTTHTLCPTLIQFRTQQILWWSPTFYTFVPPLCHFCFDRPAWWHNHSFVLVMLHPACSPTLAKATNKHRRSWKTMLRAWFITKNII